jgi:Family of unknown function (DUF6283)
LKFDIKRPCEHCPFRRDVPPYLHRARQIARQMEDDHYWFACHETTGMKHGKRVRRADQSHCAGLMAVLWREGNPNIAMRLALAFKMISREQLEAEQPVFDSLAEFARHHHG